MNDHLIAVALEVVCTAALLVALIVSVVAPSPERVRMRPLLLLIWVSTGATFLQMQFTLHGVPGLALDVAAGLTSLGSFLWILVWAGRDSGQRKLTSRAEQAPPRT